MSICLTQTKPCSMCHESAWCIMIGKHAECIRCLHISSILVLFARLHLPNDKAFHNVSFADIGIFELIMHGVYVT